MLTPGQVMEGARMVPGMIPFFSLLGESILRGRSRSAFRMLVAIPLSEKKSWRIVEEWERYMTREIESGWIPEARAIFIVMTDVHGWREIGWHSLLVLLHSETLTPLPVDS